MRGQGALAWLISASSRREELSESACSSGPKTKWPCNSHYSQSDMIMRNKQPMSALPMVYLARHGETAWTLSGQHTGLTDLPLTERGECNARSLGERLKALSIQRVFSSPLQRASRTCDLAGCGRQAEVDRDLVVGLRRLRRPTHGRHSCSPSELGHVPRWMSRWRIAGTGRRPSRPCREKNPVDNRHGTSLFQRAFLTSAGRPLARSRSGRRAPFPAKYRQLEHVDL